MKALLIILAVLASGCAEVVDTAKLNEYCHYVVSARYAGTPQALHQAGPALMACQLDPDNQRKFTKRAVPFSGS